MATRIRSNFRIAIGLVLLSAGRTASTHAITPDNPGGGSIQFTLNSGASVKAISPWIYGTNFNSTPIANRPPTTRAGVRRRCARAAGFARATPVSTQPDLGI